MGNICESQHYEAPSNEKAPKQVNFHKFNNILVFLNEGDILEEEVDVIVSQIDTKLTVPARFSKKKQIVQELQVLRQTKQHGLGDVVYTHAGELDFDYVFYCVLPNESVEELPQLKRKSIEMRTHKRHQRQYVYDSVINCIKLAEELEIQSICFPTLLSNNLSLAQVATMMLVTVKHYVEDNKLKFLHTIKFCVQERNHVDAFTWSFLEVCKKQSAINLSDSGSDSHSDSGDLEDIDHNSFTQPNQQQIRALSIAKPYDDYDNFGMSYQDKMSGISLQRKGSI